MLSDPERRVLAAYCLDHPVATCERCDRAYNFADLAFDVLGRRYYACPSCRVHLDDALRLHIRGCPTIAGLAQARIERSKALMKVANKSRRRPRFCPRRAESYPGASSTQSGDRASRTA